MSPLSKHLPSLSFSYVKISHQLPTYGHWRSDPSLPPASITILQWDCMVHLQFEEPVVFSILTHVLSTSPNFYLQHLLTMNVFSFLPKSPFIFSNITAHLSQHTCFFPYNHQAQIILFYCFSLIYKIIFFIVIQLCAALSVLRNWTWGTSRRTASALCLWVIAPAPESDSLQYFPTWPHMYCIKFQMPIC